MPTSIVFIVGQSCNRDGMREDENTIRDTFISTFNSEVHNWIDQSDAELKHNFKELRTNQVWLDKFQICRFIAVFCLAHGLSDGQVCVTHGEAGCPNKHINDIKRIFFNSFLRIRELSGKLKWLIIQSCRGNLNDLARIHAMQADGAARGDLFIDYYFISYCTGEGTLSAQADIRGKIFIQNLCLEVAKNAQAETLVKMLINVNDAVEQHGIDNNYENFSRPVIERNCADDCRLIE